MAVTRWWFDELASGIPLEFPLSRRDGWIHITVKDPNHLQSRKTIDLSPDEYREVHDLKELPDGNL